MDWTLGPRVPRLAMGRSALPLSLGGEKGADARFLAGGPAADEPAGDGAVFSALSSSSSRLTPFSGAATAAALVSVADMDAR